MKKQAALIANPTAGRAGESKIEESVGILGKNGFTVEVCITEKRGDAKHDAHIAAITGADMVIAAGGDGTINEVVNGIAGTGVPMGVIPLGTVNLFALETGIPFDIEGACSVLINGRTKDVRVGRVNDTYFMLMAGVGFDADVVYRLDLGLKRGLGRLAYILTGFGRLAGYPYNRLNVELDGRSVEGYSIVIGNMKYYGGRISVTPFAGFEKDTLDVCIFKNRGALNMLRYCLGVLRGRHLAYSDVEYATVKTIRVSSENRTYVQIDGDCYGTLPAEFTKAEETVSVILP